MSQAVAEIGLEPLGSRVPPTLHTMGQYDKDRPRAFDPGQGSGGRKVGDSGQDGQQHGNREPSEIPNMAHRLPAVHGTSQALEDSLVSRNGQALFEIHSREDRAVGEDRSRCGAGSDG
jgi:hypothetical protein